MQKRQSLCFQFDRFNQRSGHMLRSITALVTDNCSNAASNSTTSAPNTRAMSVSRTKPKMRETKVMLPTLAKALRKFIENYFVPEKLLSHKI